MTEKELSEIEARANAAMPGPWERVSDPEHCVVKDGLPVVFGCANWRGERPNTLEFIAHARKDVPALVTEVRRLRELIKSVELTPGFGSTGELYGCVFCGGTRHSVSINGVWSPVHFRHSMSCPAFTPGGDVK